MSSLDFTKPPNKETYIHNFDNHYKDHPLYQFFTLIYIFFLLVH